MQIAITQPLRVGDQVTFEGETGTVEDVRLTSTWLRTGTDARVIIPNERLAAGVLRNESIESATVAVEASVWIRTHADETSALHAVRAALPEVRVRIAESTRDGIRLDLEAAPTLPGTRSAAEAEVREAALQALRKAGRAVGRTPPTANSTGSEVRQAAGGTSLPSLFRMSRRERQRRRRRNQGGPGRILLLTFGVLTAVAAIGGLCAVGYVVSVATSGPDLSDSSRSTKAPPRVVYAADGKTRLGFIQSTSCAPPVP